MKNKCAIVQDLLPSYVDDLLSETSKEYVEEHVQQCDECQGILEMMKKEISVGMNEGDIKQTLRSVNRKVAFYQIMFVGLSFILAMSTSLLAGSFQFILTYPLLGGLTYWFYRDMRIVSLLTFVPIFIWNIGSDGWFGDERVVFDQGLLHGIGALLVGAFVYGVLHYLFALLGSFSVYLIYKIRGEKNE